MSDLFFFIATPLTSLPIIIMVYICFNTLSHAMILTHDNI